MAKREQTEAHHLCLSCGHVTKRWRNEPINHEKAMQCGKCSLEAYAYDLRGMLTVFQKLIKKVEHQNMRIFELEAGLDPSE